MILAIDQGTTGTTCLVFSPEAELIGRAYREFEQHFPRPGWVEHDAAEIWEVTQAVAGEALADAVDLAAPGADRLACVAKAYVGQHCLEIVDDCVQITGGIGVTWEHDLHFFMKRAQLDQLAFGDASAHRARLTALLRPRVEAGERVV